MDAPGKLQVKFFSDYNREQFETLLAVRKTLADLPAAPFDPYLYIINTDYDVHLIGQSPLPSSRIASDEDYRDGEGFPRAMLVPGIFSPPMELTNITEAYPGSGWVDGMEPGAWYPGFQDWVDALGDTVDVGLLEDPTSVPGVLLVPTVDWYFHPDEDLVMPIY